MTRVKICGITNTEDAVAAVTSGADAMGFVFAESPRKVTPRRVVEMCLALSRRVTLIGVFVNEHPEEMLRIAETCALDFCQVHGQITPLHQKILGQRLLPAIKVDGLDPFQTAQSLHSSVVLLDAPHATRAESGSIPFDWKLAKRTAEEMNVILAGGLNADNVIRAIEIARPYAVDVSGGVESRPGKKDHEKLSIFIQRIRTWDSRTNADISEHSADDLFLRP